MKTLAQYSWTIIIIIIVCVRHHHHHHHNDHHHHHHHVYRYHHHNHHHCVTLRLAEVCSWHQPDPSTVSTLHNITIITNNVNDDVKVDNNHNIQITPPLSCSSRSYHHQNFWIFLFKNYYIDKRNDKNSCKNDRRNSGGTLRQKFNLYCHLIFDIQSMDQWTNSPMDQWTNGPINQWTNGPMDQWTNGPAD